MMEGKRICTQEKTVKSFMKKSERILKQDKSGEGLPGGAMVKNLPANGRDAREAGSIPCQEDPLEKEMATHSSIAAWRIPGTEEPGGLQSTGSPRVRHN